MEDTHDLHPRLGSVERMEADQLAGNFQFITYKDEIVGSRGELS